MTTETLTPQAAKLVKALKALALAQAALNDALADHYEQEAADAISARLSDHFNEIEATIFQELSSSAIDEALAQLETV